MSRPTLKAELVELADDLSMFASAIRESAQNAANHPPSPWQIEDWLSRYESAYKRRKK